MEHSIENAIETVDSARQHKCELEGRRNQLQASINQVAGSAAHARQEVEMYFSSMQQKIIAAIQERRKYLLSEITDIEVNALNPLKDCETLVEEGIEEASVVVKSGENLLNYDLESESGLTKVKKFITSTSNLSLDSVPEVPSTIEVPSISVSFSSEFVSSIIDAVHLEGKVCRQSPVQIVCLEAIPGGIVVSWLDVEDPDGKETVNNLHYVYKLQSYHGKLSNDKDKFAQDNNMFKSEYVGSNLSHAVRNLVSNSIYTFRVSRCLCSEGDFTIKQWSPWSVYQEKMTVMPGFAWSVPKDNEHFVLSDKKKLAIKKSSVGSALYSEVSSFLVGYPVSFKVELEGKSRGKNDCFALCVKRDPEATVIHTKEGTLCVMVDGQVWINGVCSQTKFAKIVRGMFVTFHLTQTEEKSHDSKKSKAPVYRAIVTIGEHEAVFNWTPTKSGAFNTQYLAFALFFKSPGWKISIV